MRPIERLAQKLASNKGRTPVIQVPILQRQLAVINAINGDGTLNVSFDGGTTFIDIATLGTFVPLVGQIVMTEIIGTQVWAIGPTLQNGLVVPAGRLHSTAGTSIPNGLVSTLIGSMTEDFLVGGMTTTADGNSLVAPVSGYYDVKGQIGASAAAGVLAGQLWVNGATSGTEISNAAVPLSNNPNVSVLPTDLWFFNEGDFVSLYGAQSSGAAITTSQNGVRYGVLSMTLRSTELP